MYFEPWMLELLKKEDYRQTREGRIYGLVYYFSKKNLEEFTEQDFFQACEEEKFDPKSFSKDDIYQVKVKLKKLNRSGKG